MHRANSARTVLPYIKEKAGEGKRLTLLQNAVDPWGDIFATVDLLIEPALHRHQHLMNYRAKRDRPIVMPPKDVRISVPEAGVISNAKRGARGLHKTDETRN